MGTFNMLNKPCKVGRHACLPDVIAICNFCEKQNIPAQAKLRQDSSSDKTSFALTITLPSLKGIGRKIIRIGVGPGSYKLQLGPTIDMIPTTLRYSSLLPVSDS